MFSLLSKICQIGEQVTSDLSEKIVECFIAQHGQVKKITSDNGSNIVGCHNTLKEGIQQWDQQQI